MNEFRQSTYQNRLKITWFCNSFICHCFTCLWTHTGRHGYLCTVPSPSPNKVWLKNLEKCFFLREDLHSWVSFLLTICVRKLWVGQVCKAFLLDYGNKNTFPSPDAYVTTSRMLAQFSLIRWLKYLGSKWENDMTLQHPTWLLPPKRASPVRAVPTERLRARRWRPVMRVQGREETAPRVPRHSRTPAHVGFGALLTAHLKQSFSDKNFQLFVILPNF